MVQNPRIVSTASSCWRWWGKARLYMVESWGLGREGGPPAGTELSPQTAHKEEPGESVPQLLSFLHPTCGPFWMNPTGSQRQGNSVRAVHASQPARVQHRWRRIEWIWRGGWVTSGIGGYKVEKDVLLTHTLVIFRTQRWSQHISWLLRRLQVRVQYE